MRSFEDSNGDGNGDLRGVIEKLDFLEQIGVETILMAPFYSSPMKDGGYDIDDYLAIAPMFGSMQDFEDLVGELHKRQMKIVVDFVPNHSSNKHKWFECSERTLLEPVAEGTKITTFGEIRSDLRGVSRTTGSQFSLADPFGVGASCGNSLI